MGKHRQGSNRDSAAGSEPDYVDFDEFDEFAPDGENGFPDFTHFGPVWGLPVTDGQGDDSAQG